MARHTPDQPESFAEQVWDKIAEDARPRKLFDVTQVVGSVYAGGPYDPLVAAMTIIGEALAESSEAPKGVYSFPTEDGLSVTVTINTKDPNSL